MVAKGNVSKERLNSVIQGRTIPSQGPDVDRLDSPVTCFKLVADKEYLVAGDEDGILRIWKTECVHWPSLADPANLLRVATLRCSAHSQCSQTPLNTLLISIRPRLEHYKVVSYAPRKTGQSPSPP
jgi:hypothetical protein